MKFLCVACDEAMTLNRAAGPDEGSMTVVFGCPACGTEVAMLTNAMETQVVRSLGVTIGGRTVPPEPMETVRTSLAQRRERADSADEGASPDERTSPSEKARPREKRSSSKCPFTGVVEEAYEQQARAAEGPSWTAEASDRLERIPSFARSMARKGIEEYAREQGYATIDTSVMDEVKGQFGI